jgi:hypothetical protein
MPRFQANAALKRFPYLSQEISAEFNDDGVELVTSTGRAVLAWEKFVGFRENSEVLILRRADNHVQVFPKRAFTGTQLDELRNLIGTRLNSNLANS